LSAEPAILSLQRISDPEIVQVGSAAAQAMARMVAGRKATKLFAALATAAVVQSYVVDTASFYASNRDALWHPSAPPPSSSVDLSWVRFEPETGKKKQTRDISSMKLIAAAA
jgi:hypothetical protein